jgi:hypothetical protein
MVFGSYLHRREAAAEWFSDRQTLDPPTAVVGSSSASKCGSIKYGFARFLLFLSLYHCEHKNQVSPSSDKEDVELRE